MPETHPITQALVLAMMHSDQPMVLSDPNQADHPMVAVNDAFCALTGYEREDVLGRNCRFLQGPETGLEGPARIRASIVARRGCVEWLLNYRKSGEKFWNLLFISPVFDDQGRLLHYFGNQRNITEGPPRDVPEYVLGKADMRLPERAAFHTLLQEIMSDLRGPPPGAARALERVVAAARRLDELTISLAPSAWMAQVEPDRDGA